MNQFTSCPNFSTRLEIASTLFNKAVDAVENNQIPKRKLVWLEINGCSGNIISLLDGDNPGFKSLALRLVNFVFDNSLMASEGEGAMERLFSVIGDDYILAVEGAVSTRDNGLYTVIGRLKGEAVTSLKAVQTLGKNAAHVIAVGTCASDGGISAASPNPSASMGIQDVLEKKVIRLTGCPCHPDWFLGTLAHIMLYGEPELDSYNRPKMFYSTLIHDTCERRVYFDLGLFARKLGDKYCMFKLGCRGPVTRTDCPIRKWNERVNWPIGDSGPCIGCAMFGFPDQMEPFVSFDIT